MDTFTESERLTIYESLCNSLQDSVLLIESSGSVVHVNERFREATNTPLDHIVGRHYTEFAEFLASESVSPLTDAIEAVLTGETSERRVELKGYSPLEGDLVVEARVTRFDSGDLTGASVVLRDLTDRAEALDALSLKSEQLAVINRVLRHDIRNDMNVILGWAEQLEDEVRTDEGQAIIDRMIRNSEHTVELTHAARELMEAIEAGWEMDLRPIALGETVTRETELVREQYAGAEVEIVDPIPDVTVRANEFLGSVLGNILSNAIRHNDAETPHVEIEAQADDEWVTISIADNGPGIPDDQKDSIYEMGEKGPESPGTGLGLYLVKSLVDAYSGAVSITDRDEGGTVVTVTLERA